MFLTKKNTAGSTKAKPKNSKALGGWNDNDEDDQQPGICSKADYSKLPQHSKTALKSEMVVNNEKNMGSYNNVNLLDTNEAAEIRDYSTGGIASGGSVATSPTFGGFGFPQARPEVKQQAMNNKRNQAHTYYTPEQLADLPNIQLECRILETVLAPGGIRVKPNETLLQQFYEEIKNLDISILGSLLISYLYNPNAEFQIKAKALYTIQYLVKKNVQYSVYFKLHSDKVKDSPGSQENVENYQKIKKSVLAALGAVVMRPEERKQEQMDLFAKEGINYVDPGYNVKEDNEGLRGFINLSKQNSDKNDKAEKNINTKKLISPTEIKKQRKVLAGPGINKDIKEIKKYPNKQFDLLNQDLPTSNNNEHEAFTTKQVRKVAVNVDLLGDSGQQKDNKQKTDLLTFDGLMQREKKKKDKSNEFDFAL